MHGTESIKEKEFFLPLLGFNRSLHRVNTITEVLKYRYEAQYRRTYKSNLMGKWTSNGIGRCVLQQKYYLLTYSMVQSPSWEANWFAASEEIPRISRNPKLHYRTHKRPPPFSILGQPNPVHIPTSHLLEIHPSIHPTMPRSPQWSPSLRFPHQEPTHPLSSPIRATCPTHLILLDFITRTILGEEYKSFSSSLCNLLHSSVQFWLYADEND